MQLVFLEKFETEQPPQHAQFSNNNSFLTYSNNQLNLYKFNKKKPKLKYFFQNNLISAGFWEMDQNKILCSLQNSSTHLFDIQKQCLMFSQRYPHKSFPIPLTYPIFLNSTQNSLYIQDIRSHKQSLIHQYKLPPKQLRYCKLNNSLSILYDQYIEFFQLSMINHNINIVQQRWDHIEISQNFILIYNNEEAQVWKFEDLTVQLQLPLQNIYLGKINVQEIILMNNNLTSINLLTKIKQDIQIPFKVICITKQQEKLFLLNYNMQLYTENFNQNQTKENMRSIESKYNHSFINIIDNQSQIQQNNSQFNQLQPIQRQKQNQIVNNSIPNISIQSISFIDTVNDFSYSYFQQNFDPQLQSLKCLRLDHNKLIQNLNFRLQCLKPIKIWWKQNKQAAIYALKQQNNLSVVRDAIQFIKKQQDFYTKGSQLISICQNLMNSKLQTHIQTALQYIIKLTQQGKQQEVGKLQINRIKQLKIIKKIANSKKLAKKRISYLAKKIISK